MSNLSQGDFIAYTARFSGSVDVDLDGVHFTIDFTSRLTASNEMGENFEIDDFEITTCYVRTSDYFVPLGGALPKYIEEKFNDAVEDYIKIRGPALAEFSEEIQSREPESYSGPGVNEDEC